DPTRLTFTAVDDGNYTVRLTVSDDDGGSAFYDRVISVTNVAPRLAITSDPATTAADGSVVGLAALASDPGVTDVLTFSWSVTRDGSPFASGSGAKFAFAPSGGGTYVATLSVNDGDGSIVSTSALIITGSAAADTISITPATLSGLPGNPTLNQVLI